MNIKYVRFLFALLIITYLCSNLAAQPVSEREKNRIEREKIKSKKIKSIAEYDGKDIISKKTYDFSGNLIENYAYKDVHGNIYHKYYYNDSEDLIKEDLFHINSNIPHCYINYLYDTAGNLKEEMRYDTNKTIILHRICSYDNFNRVYNEIENSVESSEYIETYSKKFDSLGKTIEVKFLDAFLYIFKYSDKSFTESDVKAIIEQSKMKSIKIYVNIKNKDGNLIERYFDTHKELDSEILNDKAQYRVLVSNEQIYYNNNWHEKYFYDNNRIEKVLLYFIDNQIFETTYYEYNDKGKIISEKTIDSYNKTIRNKITKYDEKGNILNILKTGLNGEVLSEQNFIYEFYE